MVLYDVCAEIFSGLLRDLRLLIFIFFGGTIVANE